MRRHAFARRLNGNPNSLQRSLALAMGLGLAACSTAAPPNMGPGGSDVARAANAADGGVGMDLRLARATRNAGDLNSAATLYREALARTPDNPQISVELGEILIAGGKPDDAIDLLGQLSAKQAGNKNIVVRAERDIGRAYLSTEKPDAALEHFTRARDTAPKDAAALVDCGVALDLLKRHAEAQESYHAALQIEPRNKAAQNDLALSLALTQHYDEAIDLILPLARSADASPRIRQNLALIYGLKGDSAAAGALSHVDLNAAAADANLKLFSALRGAAAGGGTGAAR